MKLIESKIVIIKFLGLVMYNKKKVIVLDDKVNDDLCFIFDSALKQDGLNVLSKINSVVNSIKIKKQSASENKNGDA